MGFSSDIFSQHLFTSDLDFEPLAQQLWDYQRSQNPVIQTFCQQLGSTERTWIPIEFFKAFALKTGGDWEASYVFESSGTTGQTPSRHYVKDIQLYETALLKGFTHFFPQQSYRILALLPSYLERGNSSLVHMVKTWIDHFGLPGSGFYLYNFEELQQAIGEGGDAGEPMILIGVSFALLDFAEQYPQTLPPNTWVIETGGMKGRRAELTRTTLHERLCAGLGADNICSEYGMTELLSQAYAMEGGRFHTPPWMRIDIRDLHLPDLPRPQGSTGRICITDLANMHSCAFIATDDLGRQYPDGSIEVLGRVDNSELRGCNLMYD